VSTSILVAGIGNIFLGDDAFGLEVVRRLSGRSLPDGVRVVDFGIRSYDLVYAFLDGYDVTILVDATERGGKPGTLYTIEPDLETLDEQPDHQLDAHSMNPLAVLRLVKKMGGEFRSVILVGCEPGWLGDEVEGGMGLSKPVEGAIEEAVSMVETLIGRFTGNRDQSTIRRDAEVAKI
jgi:hydrogenase maturation protease